jgi:hypothetical protein
MTKGRVALRGRAVAAWKPLFIALGGPKAHDFPVEKHFRDSGVEQQVPLLNYLRTAERIFFCAGAFCQS